MSSQTMPIDVVELDSYPSGDGQPMAETQIHVRAIMLLHQALEDFFKNRPDVFIASDIFWYWERGNKGARISPDVMVVPGIHHRDVYESRSYYSWVEDITPAVVFEMASRKTWKKDLGSKYERYEQLGVREYYIFDPEFQFLDDPLIGFRLHRKKYQPMPQGRMESQLGFRLEKEGQMIRLFDNETGEPIPTRLEAIEASQKRAEELATEVKRLKAELGRSGS
jgi:Uma2 family endonuclease